MLHGKVAPHSHLKKMTCAWVALCACLLTLHGVLGNSQTINDYYTLSVSNQSIELTSNDQQRVYRFDTAFRVLLQQSDFVWANTSQELHGQSFTLQYLALNQTWDDDVPVTTLVVDDGVHRFALHVVLQDKPEMMIDQRTVFVDVTRVPSLLDRDLYYTLLGILGGVMFSSLSIFGCVRGYNFFGRKENALLDDMGDSASIEG